MADEIDYDSWARLVPLEITTDTIWRTPAYRLSLYAVACAQSDLPLLVRHRGSRPHVDQLLRAVGAISASLDEGYSRSGGRDRAHFYEYSLGSARESRGWYLKCAPALPPDRVGRRIALFSRIVRILTVVVPRERAESSMKPKRRDGPNDAQPPDNPAATGSS
jgi:four helix bundle protein